MARNTNADQPLPGLSFLCLREMAHKAKYSARVGTKEVHGADITNEGEEERRLGVGQSRLSNRLTRKPFSQPLERQTETQPILAYQAGDRESRARARSTPAAVHSCWA